MKNSERILLEFKDDEQKGFRLLYDSFYDSLVLFATQFIGEATKHFLGIRIPFIIKDM